jgi:hypothetical protein
LTFSSFNYVSPTYLSLQLEASGSADLGDSRSLPYLSFFQTISFYLLGTTRAQPVITTPTRTSESLVKMSKPTMKAVIFKGPHEVAIEERPIPKIQDQTDVIVKVGYTALCGRYVIILFYDLHSLLEERGESELPIIVWNRISG